MSRIPATASAVGAPETELTEIEVTPAMIEAGVRELCLYSPEDSDATETVSSILKAALASQIRSGRKSG